LGPFGVSWQVKRENKSSIANGSQPWLLQPLLAG
jgi:hypothetical protein